MQIIAIVCKLLIIIRFSVFAEGCFSALEVNVSSDRRNIPHCNEVFLQIGIAI